MALRQNEWLISVLTERFPRGVWCQHDVLWRKRSDSNSRFENKI